MIINTAKSSSIKRCKIIFDKRWLVQSVNYNQKSTQYTAWNLFDGRWFQGLLLLKNSFPLRLAPIGSGEPEWMLLTLCVTSFHFVFFSLFCKSSLTRKIPRPIHHLSFSSSSFYLLHHRFDSRLVDFVRNNPIVNFPHSSMAMGGTIPEIRSWVLPTSLFLPFLFFSNFDLIPIHPPLSL